MMVSLNGEPTELPDAATLADAITAAGAAEEPRGLAAAVGGEVVPRDQWGERRLSDGEEIEIVRAVQGG